MCVFIPLSRHPNQLSSHYLPDYMMLHTKDKSKDDSDEPVSPRNKFKLDKNWYIDYDELELDDRISESATAKVYSGEFRGQQVAVKIFNSDMIDVEKLQSEIQMISSIRSPYVVVFYGLCLEPKLCVVMEFCAKGTLEEALRDHDDDEPLDWARFFQLAKGLASAINLLHSWKPQIIHREVRPQNLLLTDDWQIKFCDFGRARYNTKGDEALKTATLDSGIDNVAYTAPEVYMDGAYSPKTDVFSVGIVLWELAMRIWTGAHQKPYTDLLEQGLNSFQILRRTCMQGIRPEIPADMPAALKELIQACWSPDAAQRPTAKELLKRLQDIMAHWKKNKRAWKVGRPAAAAAADADPHEDVEEDEDWNSSRSVEAVRTRTPTSSSSSLSNIPPASVAADEREKEEQIRKEVEKQVMERLRQEEERLKSELEQKLKRERDQLAQLHTASAGGATSTGLAEIDPKSVKLTQSIGKGAYGEVFRGALHGKDVAVKKLFLGDNVEEELLKDFRREVEVMVTLRHPNIVLLMGACTQPGNMMIIMEYMAYGSVADLLYGKKRRFLSFEQRLKMAKDTALGMNWLHHMNPPFLHLDLKPQNLLVDANLNVKVADFGMSQIRDNVEDNSDELGGSPFYMAPEVLLSRGATEKSDVYSFSIVLWTLYTREEPYKDQFEDEEELRMSVCDDEVRPKLPEECPKALADLIRKCWSSEPDDRPTFQDMLESRVFERVNVQNAISDEKGATFWEHYFLTEVSVEWLEVWTCMLSYLKMPAQQVPSEADPGLILFKRCLTNDPGISEENAPRSTKVTRETFNKFLSFYGPFELPSMINMLKGLVNKEQPWFHGDMTKKKAESALLKTKKPGTWLVRYSTRPGDFIISVLSSSKHKKATFHHHVVTKIPDGRYALLIPPEGTTLNMSLDSHRIAILNNPSLPVYDNMANLIKDKKKALGIVKLGRFVAQNRAYPHDSPVTLPQEINRKGVSGTRIGSKIMMS